MNYSDLQLLDDLIASPTSSKTVDEREVRIFAKHLLTALKCMHENEVAHLDLRPEAILLQDDHLKLADFTLSRCTISGKSPSTRSPEFIYPEIASGSPLTPAADLWSVGTLIYILLSGISPFLGDNDDETIRNVMVGKYSLECEEFSSVSKEAKDFIAKLLVLQPKFRLTVHEALRHPWIADECLNGMKLTSECLREFKYRHKWLERRVFVQQTPSALEFGRIFIPDTHTINSMTKSTSDQIDRTPFLRDRKLPQSQSTLSHNDVQFQTDVDVRVPFQQPPVGLIRGEFRQIEEEIANRILSDISEENSDVFSGSADGIDRILYSNRNDILEQKGGSRSSTSSAEGYSQSGTTMQSPLSTLDGRGGTPSMQFSDAELRKILAQKDPKIPVGAPLFLEELSKPLVIDMPCDSLSPLLPRSPALPGTKSPVYLSPSKEHLMNVVIVTKRGKKSQTEPFKEYAENLNESALFENASEQQARKTVHDDEFENLMNQLQHEKDQRRKHQEQLEKYRPKAFYKDDEFWDNKTAHDVDTTWESHYQIGPETLLLASRGAAFNARVRDYRRELWGNGAPLVTQGFLGMRNKEITVLERRRFTDLIREDQDLARRIDILDSDSRISQSCAKRLANNDISQMSPTAPREGGTFGPIFKSRLKDIFLVDDISNAVFECFAVANTPQLITWFHYESVITNDAKYQIWQENGYCKLIINGPSITDLGEYTCVASNDLGTDRTSATIIAGAVPAPPGRPEVELSSDTEVFITWQPPPMKNSLEVFTYKLEIRPAGENDHFCKWRFVTELCEEAVVVRYLNPLGIYQFRVTARNTFGFGAHSITSRIIRTHPKNSAKLRIADLKAQYDLRVLSKPPKSLVAKQLLDEISEEDEGEEQFGDSIIDREAEALNHNTSDDLDKHFQIVSELQRGRFGVVLNAFDVKNSLVCVVKILNASNTNIYKEELKSLKECQQENIVNLIASFLKSNVFYLFMEMLDENLLQRFCRHDHFSEEQVARSISQIASALHWIHFKGYTHLDIEPTNIMFVSRKLWYVKVIDFGSAVRTGAILKTSKMLNKFWTAPELQDISNVVTMQSDIWSLGIITFCLLSGFHPYATCDDSEDEIKYNILHQKCNPNLIHAQATHESLRFVTWALKKDPIKRIRTDEILNHRWLSNNTSVARRRENIKYPSSRLRKTALLFMRKDDVCQDPVLLSALPVLS